MQGKELSINTQISNSEQQLVNAFSGLKLREEAPIDAELRLSDIITKTFFDAGQVSDEVTIQVLSADIYDDCKNYFPNLTLKEIELACKKGVIQTYGEFFGINRKSIMSWIRDYSTSEERSKAKIMINTTQLPEKTKLSPEEEKKKSIKYALDGFCLVKNGEWYKDLGNCTYDFLDGLKMFPFTAKRKIQFMKDAKIMLRDEYKKEKDLKKDPSIVRIIEKQISEIESNKDLQIVTAKKIALNIFFKDLIIMNIELEDILNPK